MKDMEQTMTNMNPGEGRGHGRHPCHAGNPEHRHDRRHGFRAGRFGRGLDREALTAAAMEGINEVRAMFGRGGRHVMERGHFGGRGGFGAGFPGGGFSGGAGGRGPDGGGWGGGRGGGRRKRLFDQAELQTLLLDLIAEAPRHGYDLIRAVEALSGGEYAPSPGVVYPALTYMEEAGLIAPLAEVAARKAFDVTDEGRARAQSDEAKAAELKQRLTALADQRDKVDPAPVRRAMHALKTAVFDRLSQEGTDRDLILQVADAIDEATRKIERIQK